ncbi:MAG: hypothetical protein ISR44_07065 [Rhodospirillales bacterium]|nr:hypothetical protein [Rhodospirillales bacterium]
MMKSVTAAGMAAVLTLAGVSAFPNPSMAGNVNDGSVKAQPQGVQLAKSQLFDSDGIFGRMLQGDSGKKSGGGGSSGSGSNVRVGGDPIANALRQIDVGKGIQEKALKLEESVRRVIYTVKLYQALNGGIWYKLGLQLNDIYKLNDQAEAGWVRQFIAATKTKRVAGQNALKFVEVNAVEDINGQNHTISGNNQKIAVLRKSVAAYANAVAGRGSFEGLVANQNIPLNEMMNAYLTHVEDITATMEGAALTFGDMSKSYEDAVFEMDRAIALFNEQSSLVAAEVTKHIAILALEVANLTQSVNQAKDNPFGMILVLAQGIGIIQDLNAMQETLGSFNKTKDWFDANSQEILAASRGARVELAQSLETMQEIRPVLVASWQRQCSAVATAAASQRQEAAAFEIELEAVRERGRQKAPAVGKADMSEFDELLVKPRRLKSSKKS